MRWEKGITATVYSIAKQESAKLFGLCDITDPEQLTLCL